MGMGQWEPHSDIAQKPSNRSDAPVDTPHHNRQRQTAFAKGTQAEGFKLVDSKIGTNGVIFATYEPAGPLKTGTIGG